MNLLLSLYNILGKHAILTDQVSIEPFLKDWRCRYKGNALAVVKPTTTAEVIKIVDLCLKCNVPLVPQGGNTGMCGGATPDSSGRSIVISMLGLNKIRKIDIRNDSIIAESGCSLRAIQIAADHENRLFPLSFGSEQHCTIGGNLATNAGGTQVIQYGNMRDLTLGVEIVTAEGKIFSDLSGLRKDNSGYSLRNIYIGSEGTLGIFTAATLKLLPKPSSKITAFIGLNSINSAVELLLYLKDKFLSMLTAFELMNSNCLKSIAQVFPEIPLPFDNSIIQDYKWFALLELSCSQSEDIYVTSLKKVLIHAMKKNCIMHYEITNNFSKSKNLWTLRKSIPLAEARLCKAVKHDISLPISRIADFVKKTEKILNKDFPKTRKTIFGHLGDGNLHYSVGQGPYQTGQNFQDFQNSIHKIVHGNVKLLEGSICAEHGVGQLKLYELKKYKSQTELDLMKKIKHAIDPMGIFNPGKIFET